jgi:hypothetical protein
MEFFLNKEQPLFFILGCILFFYAAFFMVRPAGRISRVSKSFISPIGAMVSRTGGGDSLPTRLNVSPLN